MCTKQSFSQSNYQVGTRNITYKIIWVKKYVIQIASIVQYMNLLTFKYSVKESTCGRNWDPITISSSIQAVSISTHFCLSSERGINCPVAVRNPSYNHITTKYCHCKKKVLVPLYWICCLITSLPVKQYWNA